MSARTYDAVIFDLFGTLVDSTPPEEIQELFSAMAAELGVAPDDFTRLWMEDTRRARSTGGFASIGENIEYLCRALGTPVVPERIRRATEIRRVFTRRALTPRPDAVSTLQTLADARYRRGLVSDCSPDVPLLWVETPLAPYIEAPVFSCAIGFEKPEPPIYRRVCEQLGVRPEQCLYVGDGDSHELTGATAAGMDAVMIRVPHDRGLRRREDAWSGRKISSLGEVLGLL
jgi:putative hydrolase of the HAD superfamily